MLSLFLSSIKLMWLAAVPSGGSISPSAQLRPLQAPPRVPLQPRGCGRAHGQLARCNTPRSHRAALRKKKG